MNKISIDEYVDIIEKTAVYPKEFGHGYTTLGLSEELGEFFAEMETQEGSLEEQLDAVIKEMGDCIWYITASCFEFDINPKNILSSSLSDLDDTSEVIIGGRNIIQEIGQPHLFYTLISELSGITKRVYRDCESLTERDEYIDSQSEYIQKIHSMLVINFKYWLNMIDGKDFDDVLNVNYQKLIKRRDTQTLKGSGSNREENK